MPANSQRCRLVLLASLITFLYGAQTLLGAELRNEHVSLTAEDGGDSNGVLYWTEGSNSKTAVIVMHPIGDSYQLGRARPGQARNHFLSHGGTLR